MQQKTITRLLVFSVFFLAHWFFGNLYEEIVLVPNQLTNSYQAIKNWQEYFTISNQIYYYVPFTQVAVVVVCFLYFKVNDLTQKSLLKKASIFGILSLAITALIVTQLNLKIFFGDISQYREEILTLSVLWLIGNAIRIALVWFSLYFTIKTYLVRMAARS